MNDFRETCRYCTKAENWGWAYHCTECGLIAKGTEEPCQDFYDKFILVSKVISEEET